MDLNEQKCPIGTIREKKKFALFPVKINGSWFWWGHYIAIQEYDSFEYPVEEVVSEGIIFNTVGTRKETGWGWYTINKKHLSDTEETVQNIYK